MTFSRSESCENRCKEIHKYLGDVVFLIQNLASLSQTECKKIRDTYTEIYGEDLVQILGSTAMAGQESSRTCAALSSLMLNPHERDAEVAREALNEPINFKALVEIFTCRKSSHVLLLLQAYRTRFRRQLDQDIAKIEPPNPYQKILMALSASHKAHSADISQHIAKCDAKRLHQTGEGKSGAIDESVVIEILSKRSIAQLKLTFSTYNHIYGHTYTSFLKNEKFGEFEDAVRMVTKFICNPPKQYAKTLYTCLKGTTTDKGALIRIMMSRAEVDMDEIQKVFKKKYGMELKSAIYDSVPAGNHRDLLVALATKVSLD
ncbi:annexin D8-like [Olea europaea var. sylvestris]|uniref:annexin D8-like n=1 Tax=Olea europaea var. sylvestris TaxID=158386 RepID=UPI000C1D18EA|nr:annexin D8-like [Olea europaea var. sylvestris]